METTDQKLRDLLKHAAKSSRIKTIAAVTGFDVKRLRSYARGNDNLTNLEIVSLKNLLAVELSNHATP